MLQHFQKLLLLSLLPWLLCQCVTTTHQAAAKIPPITVVGQLFYPDEENQTYIVPAGAEIIGAAGKNCRYLVESGGSMTAHTGTNNTYVIKAGGSFKGFDHPATSCQVRYHNGANIEQAETGSGVTFQLVH